MSKLLTTINARIEKLAASERITKAELSALSQEVLQYTLEQWDSQVINRLVSVLTPMNKKTAVLFFEAFTPFSIEDGVFGGIKNKKAKAKAQEAIATFLSSGADIWEWAAENVKVEAKQPDYLANITKNIKGAVEKGHKSQADIISAILAAGFTASEFTAALMAVEEHQADQEA